MSFCDLKNVIPHFCKMFKVKVNQKTELVADNICAAGSFNQFINLVKLQHVLNSRKKSLQFILTENFSIHRSSHRFQTMETADSTGTPAKNSQHCDCPHGEWLDPNYFYVVDAFPHQHCTLLVLQHSCYQILNG